MPPRVSVVIPVLNEGEAVVPLLDRLFECVQPSCEVLAVFDSLDDTTRPPLERYAANEPRLVPLLNTYGAGPARALRFAFDHAAAEVIVVTMGDGSDDPDQVDELASLVEGGCVVAAASRYAPGGEKMGGPAFKSLLSRAAGVSLYWLAGVGTRDATTSFKAYSREFVRRVGIESDAGFEMGIELVAKARRHRLPVAELPTISRDRTVGQSHFRLWAWIPRYIRWYLYAFGPSIRGTA